MLYHTDHCYTSVIFFVISHCTLERILLHVTFQCATITFRFSLHTPKKIFQPKKYLYVLISPVLISCHDINNINHWTAKSTHLLWSKMLSLMLKHFTSNSFTLGSRVLKIYTPRTFHNTPAFSCSWDFFQVMVVDYEISSTTRPLDSL